MVDTIPPTTPTSLSKTTPDNINTPTFTWTASTDTTSGIDHYGIQLDVTPKQSQSIMSIGNISNVTSYTFVTPIPDGSHTLLVWAVDKANNPPSPPATFDFIVDSIGPTTPTGLTRTTSDYNNKPVFTWTASTDGTSGVDYYQIKLDLYRQCYQLYLDFVHRHRKSHYQPQSGGQSR